MAEKMNNVEIPEFIVLSQDRDAFKERYDHARSGIANAYEQLMILKKSRQNLSTLILTLVLLRSQE